MHREMPTSSLGGSYGGGFGPPPRKFRIGSALGAILSIPGQTSGTLEIFSRDILLGTHLQICEDIVFRDYELLGDKPGPRKYCNKFLSFPTLEFY